MKQFKLLLTAAALMLTTGISAQTNLIAGWDGGNDTSSPTNFGWSSSANRTLQPRNNNGGIRMTTTYTGYKLEDGTSYSYSANSDPSSMIFWVRYNTSGESFTYTFKGLEADHYYDFSALVGWHNNSNTPILTIKLNDGTSDLATMTKTATATQTLYAVSAQFKAPSTITNTTDIKIVFTCNQTGDCMEAISALKLVENFAVYKEEINKYIPYAQKLNAKLNDGTLGTAITTAIGKAGENEITTFDDVNDLKSAITTAISSYTLNPEGDDVSTLYLLNSGFDIDINFASSSSTATAANTVYPTFGWTPTVPVNCTGATIGFGYSGTINGNGNVNAPTQNADGTNDGGALVICTGWSGEVTYKSLSQTFAAGSYRITYRAYNGNIKNTNAVEAIPLVGFVPTTGDAQINSTTESFENQAWSTHTYDFVLTEETEGQIQIGLKPTSNTNSYNAPELFIDEVKLEYFNPLTLAQLQWQEVHDALAALDATALPNAAEGAITEELNKSVPTTTVDDVNTAKAALQALIDSYGEIKSAFDEYKALKDKVEDLKNTSKYTFTGTEALSTFNSTLSTIDGNAEAATDAATLTALLPSLRTAGNIFVGAIESSDGFDLTYNVINNSFETGALSPWETTGSNDTGVKPNSNGNYTTTGVDGSYLFNTWNNGNGSKVSQTLSGLPKGYYTVTALVASDTGNKIKIIAGASDKEIEADATNGKTQFVEGTTDKTPVSDGSLEIGANSSTWYKADNFRLTFYTETAGAAEAWATAKAAAEAAIAHGDYANVTGEEKTTLQTEIDKAEPTTVAGYGTATTALQEATTAFIDAKESYNGLVAMRTTGNTYTTTDWPRAATAKKTALDDAIAANPTNAEDAVTKTNAIVTAYRQFVESNGLAEGVAVAVDYTSTYLAGVDPNVNTGWTGGIGVDNRDNEKYTQGDGQASGKYYDGGWSTSAGVNINMTRELTLPAGQYQLQITARGSTSLTSYTMSVGEVSVDLPKDGSGVDVGTFGHGWSDKYIVFNSDGSTPLTLTIAATSTEYQQWISFNRFRLIKLDATLATAEDYASLNAAISAAEGNLGFEVNQNAPYTNTEAMALLLAAKAIDPTINNVQSDVQAATTALTNATWTPNTTEMNAVYNGMFDSDIEGDWGLTGWTRTNAWGQQQTNVEGVYTTAYYNQPGSLKYGENGVYIMPLKENTYYQLSFKYRSHENNSNKGVTVSVLNGEDGLNSKVFPANGSTSGWKDGVAIFKTGAAGNYVLTLTNNGNTWMTAVEIYTYKGVVIDENDAYTAEAAESKEVILKRTIKAGWNTVVLPFALTADDITTLGGEGAKAYTVSAYTAATDNLTFAEAETVAPNTPFFLNATKATTGAGEFIFEGKTLVADVPIVEVGETHDCSLVGTYEKIPVPVSGDNGSYYILSSGEFRKVVGDKVTIKNTRFYVATSAPAGANTLGFTFEDGEANAINGIIDETAAPEGIYNLQGQKVSAPVKGGIYIINGKKTLVK